MKAPTPAPVSELLFYWALVCDRLYMQYLNRTPSKEAAARRREEDQDEQDTLDSLDSLDDLTPSHPIDRRATA